MDHVTGFLDLLRDLGPLARARLELRSACVVLRAAFAEIDLLRRRVRAFERDLVRTTADLERERAAARRRSVS